MIKKLNSFDDCIDDSFQNEQTNYELNIQNPKEDESFQVFSEIIRGEGEPKSCLISLIDEPRVA